MSLSALEIPLDAKEVIVYAYVKCGAMNEDRDGSLELSSDTTVGTITRRLFFHSYRHAGCLVFQF